MWRELRGGAARVRAPALFVDRDGTLIELVDYLSRPEEVVPIPGAFEAIARARRRGFRVVMVTNQSGIRRGLFGWEAFDAVQRRVHALMDAAGAGCDAVYACPALPGDDAPCRKPNPGMLQAAAADLAIDLARSWVVGDSAHDLEAGARAGLEVGWLVPTGHGERDAASAARLASASFRATIGRPIAALGAVLDDNGGERE